MDNSKQIYIDGLRIAFDAFEKIHPNISSEVLTNLLSGFQDTMKKFAKDLPASLLTMAEYGWYIAWATVPGSIIYYAKELNDGNETFVDEELMTYIDREIHNIENTLVNNFPERSAPIRSAIQAHNDGLYYLSIPVFFAQIEGICNEITGYRFFASKDKRSKISKWTDTFPAESFIKVILEPLSAMTIIRKPQVPGHPVGLNRHDVLHGQSNDYGEHKINSYKALFLLLYIGEVVFESAN